MARNTTLWSFFATDVLLLLSFIMLVVNLAVMSIVVFVLAYAATKGYHAAT